MLDSKRVAPIFAVTCGSMLTVLRRAERKCCQVRAAPRFVFRFLQVLVGVRSCVFPVKGYQSRVEAEATCW